MSGDKIITATRADGHISIVDVDGMREADTLQCCHCGCHWVVKRGSGKARGYCFKCNAPHCGAPGCWECYPVEKRLDDIEAAAKKDPRSWGLTSKGEI